MSECSKVWKDSGEGDSDSIVSATEAKVRGRNTSGFCFFFFFIVHNVVYFLSFATVPELLIVQGMVVV